VSKQEFPPMQDEPEKIELELDDAKSESSKEEETEEARRRRRIRTSYPSIEEISER
jgi:hypothetical protein